MSDNSQHFADKLTDAIARSGSPACVGLDPVLDKLPPSIHAAHESPAGAIQAFCAGVIDAVADSVSVIKPQSACFEVHGSEGVAALEKTIAHANDKNLTVILDAKRGDIGISARHYAAAAANMGAHAITVNAYLGAETVEPYLQAGLGVFILVRTSNPGSDSVQCETLVDGRTIAQMMADHTADLGTDYITASGYSNVGAVVGATKAADGAALRARMPNQYFLVPGFGAQGGTIEDVQALTDDRGGGGVIVNASRSVIYASGEGKKSWMEGVQSAAAEFSSQLAAIRA